MTALANPSLAELRTIDLFDELSDAELEPWTRAATIREAAAGERIYHAGDTGVGVTLLLDGRLELLGREGDVEVRQAVQLAPTWIGVVATLLGTPAVGAGRAETEIRYAHIDADSFVDLALTHRPVFTRAMAQMKPMMARMAQRQQQHERMESLGTMAAGLAHELNNPASAAKQAARELTESLEVLSATVGVFVESGVEREEAAHLVALHERALALCKGTSALSSLESADLEDELSDALAELGVPEPWSVAATFAAAGLDVGYVREVAESAGPVTIPVLRWVGASLSARQLAAELSASTSRMSDLVIAIKKYAYTKPGAIESVDLRDSLEATLTLLKHKLKHTEIDVVRHYDESLAPVAAFGTELDQVWTNLLVNAIDALGDSGTITITTRADGDCAEVDIADDGPGIPAELRRRVFDPFFTTKDVGQGTGLGLDTARRIVNDRHHGSLTVESSTAAPSGTMFRARLPLDAARR